jgi:D-sedoheptulose 7-phosphate isomerase
MLEQRIQQQFFESADLKYQAAEVLGRPIEQAVAALVAGLTAGGKVLVAGWARRPAWRSWSPPSWSAASSATAPAWPRWPWAWTARRCRRWWCCPAPRFDTVLSRQVETLGQPGDLLLLIDTDGNHPALLAAVAAAQGQDMTVIALTGRTGGALRGALGETDVLVAVPHDRRVRVLETHLLVLHCLCDAIDLQLLGEQDPA